MQLPKQNLSTRARDLRAEIKGTDIGDVHYSTLRCGGERDMTIGWIIDVQVALLAKKAKYTATRQSFGFPVLQPFEIGQAYGGELPSIKMREPAIKERIKTSFVKGNSMHETGEPNYDVDAYTIKGELTPKWREALGVAA